MSNIIFISCICFLLIVCLVLAYKLYQFSIIILEIETQIEDSLDIIDDQYSKINEILEKPVFFDSVEIRQVIAAIEESHAALLIIANKLTNNLNIGLKSEIKKEDNKKDSS